MLTLEEWAELVAEEEGELVDGKLFEEEETGFLHGAVVAWFIAELGGWAAG